MPVRKSSIDPALMAETLDPSKTYDPTLFRTEIESGVSPSSGRM